MARETLELDLEVAEACLYISRNRRGGILFAAIVPATWMTDEIMPDTYETGLIEGMRVRARWSQVNQALLNSSLNP